MFSLCLSSLHCLSCCFFCFLSLSYCCLGLIGCTVIKSIFEEEFLCDCADNDNCQKYDCHCAGKANFLIFMSQTVHDYEICTRSHSTVCDNIWRLECT